ncbi:suppressor of SWI4 1 homolog [Lepisosteus oculatus]|uniref:suppressor of SWI4 1 homolog n=1 Tax=Lepisosteus oculatus TaxID=7918 RepID=UPI0035F51838
MGKDKTKNQKKSRQKSLQLAQEDYGSVPHSFVFHRGQIGKNIHQLVEDMRRVMEPYTAETLKVRKKNVLKDFVAVAGTLGVTHFLIFSKTPATVNMRLARLPKGPMLYFRVLKYSLVKDVVSSLKRHRMHEEQFTHHPLLILNNFGLAGMQVKLMATMFQNMFPSINVHKVNLNTIKRCVLISYDAQTQTIEFRHYSLKVVPVGMSKGVKKLMQEKFPNMSKFEDVSELLMKAANLSESEAEQDGDHNITELPQVCSGRGNMKAQQSAVRLTEIGPRMTLQLIKIEEGMGGGNVLYHTVIEKSEEELKEILARKEKQLKLKEERKRQQEQNVALKKEKYQQNKKRSLEGIKRKQKQDKGGDNDSEAEDPGVQDDQAAAAEESDDEAEYYRQAVGVEPDDDMFPGASKRKRAPGNAPRPFKKRKLSSERVRKAGRDSPRQSAPKPGKKNRGAPSPARGRADRRQPGDRGAGNRPAKRGEQKLGGRKTGGGKGFGFKGQRGKPQPGLKRRAMGGGRQGFKQKRGKGRQKAREGRDHRSPARKDVGKMNSSGADSFQIGFLPPVFGIEFCLAFPGNVLALWLLLTRERRNWHTGVVFSFNLAVSDLLYVLTLPLLVIYYLGEKEWIFGEATCKIERFLFTCNLYSSIFFITCISVNRYVGIVHPMFTHSHVRPKHAKLVSVGVWALVTVLSCPVLKYAALTKGERNNTECVSFDHKDKTYFVYSVFLATVGCLVPFLATFASYFAILWVVWKNQNITPLEKRKVAAMIALVVVLYAVSFIPYHVLRNVNFFNRVFDTYSSRRLYQSIQVTKGLVTLNMCIHPLLYMTVFDSIRTICCGRTSKQ